VSRQVVWDRVVHQMWDEIKYKVKDQMWSQMNNQTFGTVRDQVMGLVWVPVSEQVELNMCIKVRAMIGALRDGY